MSKEKNKLIVNFSMNGVPIISRNDEGDWKVGQKADEHFNADPKEVFHEEENKQNEKLVEQAKSLNKSVSNFLNNLGEDNKLSSLASNMNDPLSGLREKNE